MVILDDLGSEHFSNSVNGEACIESLLRRCYDNLTSVVVTTNLNADALSSRYHSGIHTMLSRLVKGNLFSLMKVFQAQPANG